MPIKLNLVINRGQYNQASTQRPILRTNNAPVLPLPLTKAPPPPDRMSLKHAMGPNMGCKSCGG